MTFVIELEQETDGRWIADIPQLPGCLVYGQSPEDAARRVKALALRVLAERLETEQGDMKSIEFAAA